MGSLKEQLKHAFAVDAPGPAEPTAEQRPAVDWLCLQMARRRLSTPGLVFMEMSRPLNYIGSQFMHVARPAVWALAGESTYAGWVQFAEYLERRGSVDFLCRRVEHFEAELTRIRSEGGDVGRYIREHMHAVRRQTDASTHRTPPAEGSGTGAA